MVELVGPVCGLPGWEGCHASACSSTPHKLDKCNCSLQRYDAIADLSQSVRPVFQRFSALNRPMVFKHSWFPHSVDRLVFLG